MGINELNKDWLSKSNRVLDLFNKKMTLYEKYNAKADSMTDDEKSSLKNEMVQAQKDYKDAVDARDYAKELLDDARNNEKPANKKPIEPKKSNKQTAREIKDKFVHDFKNLVSSGTLPDGTKVSGDNSNAGLTIPDDVQTAIHTLVRQYASLESLVNVENTKLPHGSRVYEKLSDITPLVNLDDEKAQIGDLDDPKLTLIKYIIHRYAGITTATNTLLQDSADNILAWLEQWAAKKDVVTRNLAILNVMGKAPKKPTIADFDDIKDLENNTLDPMIIATSAFITNQSGYNVLSKMKDAEGRYLIQPDVTQTDKYVIDGKPVQVIADRWLPDVSGSHPLYYGDFKQGITLFDRQQMSVTPTQIGGGAFETDTTKVRYIDRFDVQLIDDGAFAAASFKAVANQATGTASTDNKTSK